MNGCGTGLTPDEGNGAANGSQEYTDIGSTAYRLTGAQREGVPLSGVELGYGWDSKRSQVVANHCIEFTTVKDTGQIATVDLHEVSDQSEMMERLGVSAQVSVNTMFTSVNAKASFASESKVMSNSTNLLLRATVENGVMFVGPPDSLLPVRAAYPELGAGGQSVAGTGTAAKDDRPDAVRLKPWARKLAQNKDMGVFRKHCGDSFVSAIYSGGQVLATISYSETDTRKRQDIKTAIKASYGVVQGAAAAESNIESALSSTDLQVHYLQVGGGRKILPISRDKLVEKLATFPEEVADSPNFTEMEVKSYAQLAEWESGWGRPGSGGDSVDDIVADYYWFLTTLYQDIGEILADKDGYVYCSGKSYQDLPDFQDQVLELRRTLRTAMDARSRGVVPRESLSISDTIFFPARELKAPDSKQASVTQEYKLDLTALNEELVRRELKHPQYDRWYEKLATQLRMAVPNRNPNTLRLLLPLPTGVNCVSKGDGKSCGISDDQGNCTNIVDEQNYRKTVVDWYLGQQSARMCERAPRDNECMSNKELEELANLVPLNP